MSEATQFHRLFGLSWMDFFDGTDVEVEAEVDLSNKKQFVDVVLKRTKPGPLPRRLPDGFEDLADHNLITFKSYQEPLTCWALRELDGHYVNYRKQSCPSFDNLLEESNYRLYAVCARFPSEMAKVVELRPRGEGVYDVPFLDSSIRIVVVHQLPKEQQNAMLLLFAALKDLVSYAKDNYRPYSAETSTVLEKLFVTQTEEQEMASEKLKAHINKAYDELAQSLIAKELSKRLPPEFQSKELPVEELLKRVLAEEWLKGQPTEERLKGLPAEERLKGLTVEEELRALSPEARDLFARQLKDNGSPTERS